MRSLALGKLYSFIVVLVVSLMLALQPISGRPPWFCSLGV